MNSQQWQRVEEVFHAAMEQSEPVRDSWLAAQDLDPATREEVRSLLRSARNQEVSQKLTGAWENLPTGSASLAPGLPSSRFGSYRASGILGRGGMSVVYLGERSDGVFERKVAIKVLAAHLGTDDFLRRFRNEGKLLANLHHPNIGNLLDGGVSDDGQPYLVLELVVGERLDAFCDSRRLPIAARVGLFRQVCEAVEYAHRNHVLHRDLKPSNILVDAEGVVKLLDFGTAALMGQDSGTTLTAARMLTPRYASPEYLRGERPGVSGDVFSLGVILFELLTGAWPFGDPASVLTELRRAAGNVSPLPPASLVTAQAAELRAGDPDALRRALDGEPAKILTKALESDPSRRYASVQGLVEDVDRWEAAIPVTAPGPKRGLRRAAWWLAGAAALVCAALPLVNLARWQHPNAKARELFDLGLYHWNRRTRDSLFKAVDAFRQATVEDPKYAQAYAYLADTYAILPEYGNNWDPAVVENGRRAVSRALELDPKLAAAHSAKAWISFANDWNWSAADPEFRAAVALAPNDGLPHQRYGLALITRGRFAEAESELQRAHQLDPLSVTGMVNLAELWFYARRFDREEQQLRQILELDPNSVLAQVMLAKMATVAGRSDAIALSQKLRYLPEGGTWCQQLAEAYARNKQREAALRQASACGDQPEIPGTYAYLGDYSRAMDILESWYTAHSPYLQYLSVDANYDDLRAQPRFQSLLKKLGF